MSPIDYVFLTHTLFAMAKQTLLFVIYDFFDVLAVILVHIDLQWLIDRVHLFISGSNSLQFALNYIFVSQVARTQNMTWLAKAKCNYNAISTYACMLISKQIIYCCLDIYNVYSCLCIYCCLWIRNRHKK